MSSPDQLRRLSARSQVRPAAVDDLREQCRLISVRSPRRLEASRMLLDRLDPTTRV